MSTQSQLAELARLHRRKVSNCRVFDANVCTWYTRPEKPWELVPMTGEPFGLRVGLRQGSRVVDAMANDDRLGLFFNSEILGGPLSVNQPDKNAVPFYGPYRRVGEIALGDMRYPLFIPLSNHDLDAESQALVRNPIFQDLLRTLRLRADESLHVSRSGFSIYLEERPIDTLQHVLQLGSALLSRVEAKDQSAETDIDLPALLRPLLTFSKWATPGDAERESLINGATTAELDALIAAVDPHQAAIDAYLDSFQGQPLTPSAIKLGQLAEAAAEAKRRIEDRSNPVP